MNIRKLREEKSAFSLVELIIVIAIMGAIVGILAPQYMKYLENARRSADENTLDNVVHAVEVAASDPDYSFAGSCVVLTGVNGNLTITSDGTNVASMTRDSTLADFVAQKLGTVTVQLKSVIGTQYNTFKVMISNDASTISYIINDDSNNVSLDYAYWNR